MEKLDFRLRLVTPAFLGGAMEREATPLMVHHGKAAQHRIIGPDGDGLRIPSLRGALRFWFRAGLAVAPISLDTLAKREAEVFGSTEHGQGIRLVPRSSDLWKPEPLVRPRNTALAYLGYGPMNDVGKPDGFSSHNEFGYRDVVPAGTSFSFRAIGTPTQLEKLERCLLLLHLFGCVGGRSRRGFGSVSVQAACIPPFGRKTEWQTRFAERAKEAIGEVRVGPSPRYSGFSAETALRLTPLRETWEAVMDDFYNRFKKVRILGTNPFARPPIAAEDLRKEKKEHGADLADPFQDVPQRLAFGLPYQPGYRKEWSMAYHGRPAGSRASDESTWITRRASPLFLRVFQPAAGHFFGVALFLRSEFFGLPDQEIGVVGRDSTAPFPGYGAIEAFLNHKDDPWQPVQLNEATGVPS